MSTIEMKLDAVMRAMTAENPTDCETALAQIRAFLESGTPEHRSARSEISAILLELGVPGNLKGYSYLITAIDAVVAKPELLHAITKELYPLVAKVNNTTTSRAERAIRHAVETGWDRCDLDVMRDYFGNTISPHKGKPTNGEYIARVADIVRRRTGKEETDV